MSTRLIAGGKPRKIHWTDWLSPPAMGRCLEIVTLAKHKPVELGFSSEVNNLNHLAPFKKV
jgi:hypothetical protein